MADRHPLQSGRQQTATASCWSRTRTTTSSSSSWTAYRYEALWPHSLLESVLHFALALALFSALLLLLLCLLTCRFLRLSQAGVNRPQLCSPFSLHRASTLLIRCSPWDLLLKLALCRQELKERQREVMQEVLMDMLRALSTPNMDIRKKILDIALDLIDQRNIDEVCLHLSASETRHRALAV